MKSESGSLHTLLSLPLVCDDVNVTQGKKDEHAQVQSEAPEALIETSDVEVCIAEEKEDHLAQAQSQALQVNRLI